MNDLEYFQLFANCIVVKGATKSIICDVDQNRYRDIPNLLCDILNLANSQNVLNIKKHFNQEYNEGIDAYFSLLEEEDYGFFTDEPEKFSKLDLQWDFPSKITNAIIDIKEAKEFNYLGIFEELENLGCQALQIRFFEIIDLALLDNIAKTLKKSSILFVELLLQYSEAMTNENLESVFKKNERIRSFCVVNSPNEVLVNSEENRLFYTIHYTTEKFENNNCCGVIHQQYFSLNLETFTEAQHFNTCLNKKISIDSSGNIKNCPSMINFYGNIKDK